MAIGVAFRAFFAALSNRDASQRLARALEAAEPPAAIEVKQPAAEPKPVSPPRSEAITLLSTLQREARLLDLVHESLDGFEDAQIGAAAREVLRDARKTLDRLFAIEPLATEAEGESMVIDAQASPNRLRIAGGSRGQQGIVVHRGWKATRCEVPKWDGHRQDAWVLAPVEVDVQ